MDPDEDYSWKEEYKFGDTAEMELLILRELTKRGSTCTPRLIDWKHHRQSEDDYVPNGFRMFILMEKIPGRNLMNWSELPIEERDQVRIAIGPTIRCVPLLRRLMCDSFSCSPITNNSM